MAKEIKDFLCWMNTSNICSVLPFFVILEGRDGKVPHWTNGKKLFNADELLKLYSKRKKNKTY